jgi:hypothetical protein
MPQRGRDEKRGEEEVPKETPPSPHNRREQSLLQAMQEETGRIQKLIKPNSGSLKRSTKSTSQQPTDQERQKDDLSFQYHKESMTSDSTGTDWIK